MKNKIVTILDTSAFIHGYGVNFSEEYFTVPNVKTEIKSEISKIKYENSISSGYLKEVQPDVSYVNKVTSLIIREGEGNALSETDTQILALALQLKSSGKTPLVITDDYSIQNILSKLNISHKGLTTRGINKKIKWQIYCPGCKRNFQRYTLDKKCPVCGTELRRKPAGKAMI